ncbi:Methylthioribulose-1-phosphate dehydratase [Hirsutella minnesotensis 3608]|uniref:Methylthioribulose-1-phosphate dehydratase n=1 Tax=Hirsutella minnesotensis 3608 TaxID=1043627 RepID=A0A0F7ZMU1_9HYPO|nr:Methylthioribulose-1-phosphate dehydratase [Hirsutella minnesotensis 3608]
MDRGQAPADAEALVTSGDAQHPANLIPSLCAKFWTLGWGPRLHCAVGGAEGAHEEDSQQPQQRTYLRSPPCHRPSQCTPLFLAAFERRGAGCCIHTHSQWAVLVTLLLESSSSDVFEINNIEQIKGFPRGPSRPGNLGYHDTLRVPVIENTPHEEDLTEHLEAAMDRFPDAYAVLVRRHGVYVWGDTVHKAKTQCESLDYLFQLAVEMRKLGIPWISNVPRIGPDRP